MMDNTSGKFHMTGGKSFRQFPWWEFRWMTTHTDWSLAWKMYSTSGSSDGTTGMWYYPISSPPQVNEDSVTKDFMEIGLPILHTVHKREGEENEAFVNRVSLLASSFGYTGSISYHGDNVAAWIEEGAGSREAVDSSYYAMAHGPYTVADYADAQLLLGGIDAEEIVVFLLMQGSPTVEWDGVMLQYRCSFPTICDCLVGYGDAGTSMHTFIRPFSSGVQQSLYVPYTLWSLAASDFPHTSRNSRSVLVSQAGHGLGDSGMVFMSQTQITGTYNDNGEIEED